VKPFALTIGEYTNQLNYTDLPLNIVQEAKYKTLDNIAVTVAAYEEAPARILADYALTAGGREEAGIFMYEKRVPAALAALVNGTAAHCLEIDDDHNELLGHPGVTAVPACLAMAEKTGASGQDYITGLVVAYQLSCSLGMSVHSGVLHDWGYHPTGVCGIFGAALGSAKIMGLSPEQTACALGIAGSQSAGLFEFVADGSWTKRFHGGWSAHSGLLAATFAAGGYTGPKSVFEGRMGWLHAYAGEGNYDWSVMENSFPINVYEIDRTSYKPYACCRHNHTAIDVVLDLVEENGIAIDNIERIEVRLPTEAIPIIVQPPERKLHPETTVDSQFSIYYSIAATLLSPEQRDTMTTFIDQFTAEKIKDPAILALAARVTCSDHPEVNVLFPAYYAASALITTKDGKTFYKLEKGHRGEQVAGKRWSEQELVKRFHKLTAGFLNSARRETIINTVLDLENISTLTGITNMLKV
jgi:2-methylcitrate dehydratase PrpD